MQNNEEMSGEKESKCRRDSWYAFAGITGVFAVMGSAFFAVVRLGWVVRPEESGQWTGVLFFAIYWLLFLAAVLSMVLARRHRAEVLLTLASLLIALLIGECVVRIVFPLSRITRFQTDNSKLFHHIPSPGKTMYMMTPEQFGHRDVQMLYSNEDGLRSRYSRETFRDFKDRIVILGDSFVFGLKVTQDAVFPQVTERLLREQLGRDDLAVLNAGVISFSPYLEDLLYTELLRDQYRPTMVLLFLDVTDFGDDLIYAGEAAQVGGHTYFYRRPQNVPDHLCALQEVFRPYSDVLVNALRYPYLLCDANLWQKDLYLSRNFRYYNFRLKLDGVEETNRYFVYRHPLASSEPYLRNTLEIVNKLAEKIKADGAGFTLFVLPRYQHWNPKECPDNWEIQSGYYKVNEPFQYAFLRFFDRVKPELPYDMVNLLPAFQATTKTRLVFSSDSHWTERGNAFVARIVADYLLDTCYAQ